MIIIGILSVFLGFLFWVSSPIMAIVVMLIWGLMYGGVSVALMTWIMTAVPKGIELGSSAYIAIFNLAIALGAYLGSLSVDNYGLNSVLLIAVLFIAFALLCVFASKYTKCSAK
ncbi:TPA: MFS transporter [Proteus mirabilis]